MAIQIPNPGTGNGASGDNEFVLWSKVKDNFNDQTNAASKLVGTATGRVPLSEETFKAAFAFVVDESSSNIIDLNDLQSGSLFLIKATTINAPPRNAGTSHWLVMTIGTYSSSKIQVAYGYNIGAIATRALVGSVWSEWAAASTNKDTYSTTTASGSNVVVDSTGKLMRSTSSERYKDILAPLELDDARYADAMALKPIVYRSTADADNPAYHYYSFSAEELGAYDPAFTLWRETETVTDEEGNVIDQPLAERQAEGININALLAMSHAIAIKQGELIKKLEARIEALEAK